MQLNPLQTVSALRPALPFSSLLMRDAAVPQPRGRRWGQRLDAIYFQDLSTPSLVPEPQPTVAFFTGLFAMLDKVLSQSSFPDASCPRSYFSTSILVQFCEIPKRILMFLILYPSHLCCTSSLFVSFLTFPNWLLSLYVAMFSVSTDWFINGLFIGVS